MRSIIKHPLLACCVVVISLSLVACGERNPLIGKWEGETSLFGIRQTTSIEFTPKEIIIRQGNLSIGGSTLDLGKTENRSAMYYRMEGGKVLISEDNKAWMVVEMPDNNTASLNLGGIYMTLKRQ